MAYSPQGLQGLDMTEHAHIDDSHWDFPALSERMTRTRGHQGDPGTSLSITWLLVGNAFPLVHPGLLHRKLWHGAGT